MLRLFTKVHGKGKTTMNKFVIDEFTRGELKTARDTYGSKNQILVCIEELNELACVLAKYPRYESEDEARKNLYDKALDEVADVTIILEHVRQIFNLTDEAVDSRISKKIARLSRWLLHSNSMQETVDDRKIDENNPCKGCVRDIKDKSTMVWDTFCRPCHQAQATEGISPFFCKEE